MTYFVCSNVYHIVTGFCELFSVLNWVKSLERKLLVSELPGHTANLPSGTIQHSTASSSGGKVSDPENVWFDDISGGMLQDGTASGPGGTLWLPKVAVFSKWWAVWLCTVPPEVLAVCTGIDL